MTRIRKALDNLYKEITRTRHTRLQEQKYQSDLIQAWKLLDVEVKILETKKDKQDEKA